jgi:tetratricopeptide (TPR) repeat protein
MRVQKLIVLVAAMGVTLVAGCAGIRNEQAAIDHYVRGKLLAEQGDLDAALAELAEAAKNDPTLSIAHATAGDIHRTRGKWELAQRSYESACQANPYAFKPHYNLALTYQTLARAARAAQRIQNYLRLAVHVYLRAIIIEPEDFEANLNLAACYFQLGKYDLAEQYCRAAIAANPNDAHAHSNLGIICDSQNRLYDAIRAYKASLEIDTHQPKLLLNLGSTYMRQNRVNRAIRAFKMAAKEAPEDPAPWEQIGSCYYRMNRHAEALDAYNKALSLGSRSATAHRGIGVVYMTQYVLNQEKVELRDKAVAAWHASLELAPDQHDLAELVRKYAPKYTGPRL